MKRIDVREYQVDGTKNIAVCPQCSKEVPSVLDVLPTSCPDCDSKLAAGRVAAKVPVDVQDLLVTFLLHPNLKLKAKQVRERRTVEDKILDAKDFVLLEEDEYNMVKAGMDAAEGFGRNEQELINRVYDAKDIEVEAKEANK